MTTGYASSDLGRILHDDAHVELECWSCSNHPTGPYTKAKATKLARQHAFLTGHRLTLHIAHWQTVKPKG